MEQMGFDFETHSPTVDERSLEKSFKGSVQDLPVFLAQAKAASLKSRFPQSVIIGSDQLLIFKGQALHKPQTIDEVIDRLMQLQGQTHELHTGLSVLNGDIVQNSTTVARMTMHSLSEKEIRTYAELDQPMGCAGGYKIEQKGPWLFSKIETSDHHSIIGLPLLSLVPILKGFGISRL
jgi:septum formation protein